MGDSRIHPARPHNITPSQLDACNGVREPRTTVSAVEPFMGECVCVYLVWEDGLLFFDSGWCGGKDWRCSSAENGLDLCVARYCVSVSTLCPDIRGLTGLGE